MSDKQNDGLSYPIEAPRLLFPEIPTDLPKDFRDEISDSCRALENGEKTFDDLSPEVKKQLCAKPPLGFFVISEIMQLEFKVWDCYGDEIRQTLDDAENLRSDKLSTAEFSDAIFRVIVEWIRAGSPGRVVSDAAAGAFILERVRRYIGRGTNLAKWRKVPTAQEFRIIKQYLAQGPQEQKKLKIFVKRKNRNRHGSKYSFFGDAYQLKLEGLSSAVAVQTDDVSKYAGSNIDARKVFTFTLEKMNTTAQFRGGFFTGEISYSLQDLVDNGLFSDTVTARRGFLKGADAITGIKIGSIKNLNHRKTEKTDVEMKILFTGFKLKNGLCSLTLNNELFFDKYANGFSLLPGFYYELKNRPASLWDDVSYYARQSSNLKKIAETGQFDISAKTIQANWGLPGIRETKQPARDIREPIEKAVSETAAEIEQHRTAKEVEIIISDEPTTREFLKFGKITVKFSGDVLKYYQTLYADAQQEKAERKRRNAAKAKAKAKAEKGSTENISADKEKATSTDTTPKE